MIRKSLLNLALIGAIVLPDIGSAQAGNYDLIGVYNVYHYIVREMSTSLDDSLYGTYDLMASWPSSQSPAFQAPLATYSPGDTIGPVIVPLVNPTLLGLYGIALNSDVYEDGNMVVTGTYPSLSTSDCSTTVTVPAITDNIVYATGGDPVIDQTALTATYGWGIVTSGVFANNMYPPDLAGGETYGVDFGAGTDHETWGRWISHYNSDFSFIEAAEIYWEQVDGVESTYGVDTEGNFNGHFGLTGAFGDNTTIPGLAAAYPDLGLNVGTYPMIGGTGADVNGDGSIDSEDGYIAAPDLEWGYYFDPLGADGAPFSGDEPFQFTGYYMTYNFLTAAGALATAFGAFSDPAQMVDTDGDGVPDTAALIVYYMGLGLTDVEALVATVDSLATLGMQGLCAAFGVSASAPVLAPMVGDYAATTLTALLTAGVETTAAITQTAQACGAYAVGVLAGAGVAVNDSDHDFDGTNGRLVFQVGNSCIPRDQHLAVQSNWVNTGTADIDSDESLIPKEFALYDNYPNPFNPTTQIAVDLPEAATTEITVWNIMGQRVATLYSGDLNAGHHTLNFDGRDSNGKQLTSGMYLYRISAGKYNATKKMTLMK